MKGFVRGYLEMQRNRQLRWQVVDLLVGAAGVWVIWDSLGHTVAIVFAVVWAILMLAGLSAMFLTWRRERTVGRQ